MRNSHRFHTEQPTVRGHPSTSLCMQLLCTQQCFQNLYIETEAPKWSRAVPTSTEQSSQTPSSSLPAHTGQTPSQTSFTSCFLTHSEGLTSRNLQASRCRQQQHVSALPARVPHSEEHPEEPTNLHSTLHTMDSCAHCCSGNSDFALTCKQRGWVFFAKGEGSLFSRIAPAGLTTQVGRTCLLWHPGGFHPCRELQPGLAQNPSSGCWYKTAAPAR